jgi:hypothetical protein
VPTVMHNKQAILDHRCERTDGVERIKAGRRLSERSRSTRGDASGSNVVALIAQTTLENHDADFVVACSGRVRRCRLYRYCGNACTPADRNLPAGPTPTLTNDGRDAAVLLGCATQHRASDAAAGLTGINLT